MHIRDLNGKSVCILGYGREGRAMVEALEKFAQDAEVTICDQSEEIIVNREKHSVQLGSDWLKDLDRFDVIVKSPGIPPKTLFSIHYSLLTNSIQIFLDSLPQSITVIGVTGSKGKSTTASLIHHILKESGQKSILLGNIGEPAIGALSTINDQRSAQYVVLELSSAQLMDCTTSPQIAVVTSFFPEHLDYHETLENYKEAKSHIAKFQSEDGIVFYCKESEGPKEIAETSPGTLVAYGDEDSPIAVQDTKLIGTHNLVNIAGAASVARHLEISDDHIIKAVKTFEGLPHRLQDLGAHHGMHWVDDAISTTPESTIAAIHALSPNIKILICGGKDRGLDFTNLGEVIDASSLEHVIVMGESGPRMAQAISKKTVHRVNSLEQAVEKAKYEIRNTKYEIPICLLSPASPSYDQFTNFEEKGDRFLQLLSQGE